MQLNEIGLVDSQAYFDQMAALTTNPLDWEVSHAPLAHHPDQSLRYVTVRPDNPKSDRPVLYVPGFSEGIVAKAPFAAVLADLGHTVIMPDQNRYGCGWGVTDMQARNYLAIAEHAQVLDGEVDVVTHSYGSLIFQAMQRMVATKDGKTFEGSRVAIMAPAGSNANENPLSFARRCATHWVAEMLADKNFPDADGVMQKAALGNVLAGKRRAILEVAAVLTNRVDYDELAESGIDRAIVLGYAQDGLFPHRVLDAAMAAVLEKHDNLSYATPYAAHSRGDGTWLGGRDATHNDEQSNPTRAAGSVSEFLLAA